jgi:S1-C subfamily serine protease
MKKLLFLIAVLVLVLAVGQTYRLFPLIEVEKYLNLPKITPQTTVPSETNTVVYEESVVTKVVEESLASVVTVGINKTSSSNIYEFDPFNPFGPFRQVPQKKQIEQNIGSGFIISSDGLILTNKHVVADTEAEYQILTNDNKKHKVENIYRDPLNDLAILKINASGLKPLKLGDSDNLKLGQMAIAIGTPLGEFRNTVTVGIVSGLGRGITAGSPYEGYVEKLDNVIQTDAPISAGNSGGPLLNSKGQAIGINTAIAAEGQNIGFAIPINIARELIDKFNKQGGSFERPYIGLRYKMVDRQTALLNDVVEGAYVVEVVENSPAAKAGVVEEDIIMELDNEKIIGTDDKSFAKIILDRKIGDRLRLKLWRNGETKEVMITLEAYK